MSSYSGDTFGPQQQYVHGYIQDQSISPIATRTRQGTGTSTSIMYPVCDTLSSVHVAKAHPFIQRLHVLSPYFPHQACKRRAKPLNEIAIAGLSWGRDGRQRLG
ncbi:hypothetical protein H0G86_004244 [Trichoderma simmonsii]|uniref:Uncharacterized protein n=1 Tax=Trichoderma simmonsii TaxID=1491479 RepID=A0A8G0LBW6_9HYPO|nr:hypothetical protein H0G86_004244 [Trichoderma simmonsii]